MKIDIKCSTNSDKGFLELIKLLDSELFEQYGEIQSTYNTFNSLSDDATVSVAYNKNIPIACGCFRKFETDSVEIKRMFVKKEFRGNGISKHILNKLEKCAMDMGFKYSILETGINQKEAISLYEKCGYLRIKNFGQYKDMDTSICMKKELKL